MIRQFELVERVRAYDPQCDDALLDKAYVFAMRAHGNQKRASGDPYFSHPLEVAGILTDLKLDTATIVTALLHDTIEDTLATHEEIEGLFGSEICQLVDGVTKLSQIELSGEGTKQAENFRKLLVAMSRDIRVLLVKLADRLHNMRTLHHVKKEESRRRKALETIEIFAPLAGRIGMQSVREELEDLAFEHLNPSARSSIQTRMQFLAEDSGFIVHQIASQVDEAMRTEGIEAEVRGRSKRPYSIWRKMQRKDISFEQLSDVFGFRVIVDQPGDCYRALGVLHGRWRTVPGRFKDYISTPKANGYQSIHTTVIGPQQQKVEVQIRTAAMHDFAENGLAAHWHYKDKDEEEASGIANAVKQSEAAAYRWLRGLVEMIEDAESPDEMLEHSKLEMFLDQVFCFTPKGDLIALPFGATPLDFAYAVHTKVGDTCVGVKINGIRKSLTDKLNNGDQVEIIRSATQTPDPEWENLVITGRARSAIRRFVRHEEKTQYVALGERLLRMTAAREEAKLTDKALKLAVSRTDYDTLDDLYVALGQGKIPATDVLAIMFPALRIKSVARRFITGERVQPDESAAIPIKGLVPGLAVHFAPCCHPLPGDRIVGIVQEGRGVMVHTIDCQNLVRHDTPETNRSDAWLDLKWHDDAETQEASPHIGRVRVELVNEPGALGEFCAMIAKAGCNIFNLKITGRAEDVFELIVDLQVRDVRHLMDALTSVKTLDVVSQIERIRGE